MHEILQTLHNRRSSYVLVYGSSHTKSTQNPQVLGMGKKLGYSSRYTKSTQNPQILGVGKQLVYPSRYTRSTQNPQVLGVVKKLVYPSRYTKSIQNPQVIRGIKVRILSAFGVTRWIPPGHQRIEIDTPLDITTGR